MRAKLLVLLTLLWAPTLQAQYLADYFGATSPGSWARYDVTQTDAKNKSESQRMTLSRLPDQGGNAVLEMHFVPLKNGKPDKWTTMQMHLRPAYLKEKNPLNTVQHVERLILQVEGKKAQEMPIELMQSMTGGLTQMFDYSQNVVDLGADSVDGRAARHYRASGTIALKILFKELKYDYEAEIWLSGEVPFGRLKEHTVTKDSKGKLRSTNDTMLVESAASGAVSHISGEIEKVDMPKLF
jgi:hypothetical protein